MKKLLFYVFLFAIPLCINAQITHDNNTVNIDTNPASITVPAGSNKALIIYRSTAGGQDLVFSPFNGIQPQLIHQTSNNTFMAYWMVLLGDVPTSFTADLIYEGSATTLTTFTINNIDQLNPVGQKGESSNVIGEHMLIHHGGFNKKAGDMLLTYHIIFDFNINDCNSRFVRSTSENNNVKLEFDVFDIANVPYMGHYSTIISSPSEFIMFTTDNCTEEIDYEAYQMMVVLNSVEDNTLSVETPLGIDSIRLFPNPTNNTLNLNKTITGTYKIIDSNGKQVLFSNKKQSLNEIDVKSLSVGTYIITITDDLNNKVQKKFIIE